MKTYYYSAILLLGGAFYSYFNTGGAPSIAGREEHQRAASDASSAASNGTLLAAQIPTAGEGPLLSKFATCTPSKPDNGTFQCNSLLDDIKSPKFIIATVPDPQTTHLRLEFDRANDGIEQAAADAHYFFRRYWLPWTTDPARQFDDRESQQAEDKAITRKRGFPGFLLFDNREGESLIVFLVGEKPTDGVNRTQFQNALDLKSLIEKLGAKGPQDELAVLGTTFSGSLPSLSLALGTAKFEAVSGTVSDAASIEQFNKAGPKPRLRTLVHNSKTAMQVFVDYAKSKWAYSDSDEIAVVTETETVFGSASDVPPGVVVIPYPREIAHLRNAYQEYPELSGFGQGAPGDKQRKGLPLPLEDSGNATDSIPTFAPQTPVSQEIIVQQIANRLRHDHVRFAGIVGTDVLDVLFISRFLRAETPDTRLFLLEPDLLLVHAADALPFEGLLAVTTYPLLNGNPPFQEKAAKADQVIFPSPYQQGFRNAMRVLLASLNHQPVPVLPGYEAVNATDKKPPLWITSVGRESYVPIAVKNAEGVENPALLPVPAGSKILPTSVHHPTRVWYGLFLILTCAMLAIAATLCYARGHHDTWSSDFRIDMHQQDIGHRSLHLGAIVTFAIGFYLTIATTPFGIAMQEHSTPLWVWAVSLTALATAAVAIWSLWKARALDPRLVCAAVPIACILGLLIYRTQSSLDREGQFFAFRSLELSAGASPIVPFLFLFAGFITWAFVNLERCVTHHERWQTIPESPEDLILGRNIHRAGHHLVEEIHHPFKTARGTSIFIALLTFSVTLIGLRTSGVRSFEGWLYDWFFLVCASVLSSLLILVGWHFFRCWYLLSIILEQLEMHAIRRVFTALPPTYSWSPIWQSNPRKRSYLIGTRAIDVLLAIQNKCNCCINLSSQIDAAEKAAGQIQRKLAHGMRESIAEYRTVQEAFKTAAETLLGDLRKHWSEGSSEVVANAINLEQTKDAVKLDKPAFAEHLCDTYKEEFVALRYLAFIRYAMLQLRNLLTFITVGFMMFAFSLMSYPFQAERLIGWHITLIFGVLAGVVAVVFSQMETDPTLSRITNTNAGTYGIEFFHRLASYGTLPVLTVLASHFNGVSRILYSWLQPALKTLH